MLALYYYVAKNYGEKLVKFLDIMYDVHGEGWRASSDSNVKFEGVRWVDQQVSLMNHNLYNCKIKQKLHECY